MMTSIDQFMRDALLKNLHMKVVALLLTLALYLWVSVDREVERVRYVPVRYSVPEQSVLVNHPPGKAGITIRGKWSDLSRLEPAQLNMIRVQITSEMGARGSLSLSPDMVELPPGLRAVDIQPSSISFRLAERRTKMVSIQPKLVGEPPDGYRIDQVTVTPQKVNLSGPAESLTDITAVSTEPIIVDGHTQSFETTVFLRLDDPLVEYHLEKPVSVVIPIATRQVERDFTGLAVEAVNADLAQVLSIKPERVSLRLRGPKAVMDALDPDQLLASVDLSGQSAANAHTVEREVQVRNIPDGVELLSKQPRFFRVHLAPRPTELAGE